MSCSRRSIVLAAGVGFLALVVLSCDSERKQDRDFPQKVESLKGKTTPPGAEFLIESKPVQTNWSVTASWNIATTMDKAEYFKWVSSQLQPEFNVVQAGESQLTFSRHENGDTYSVECHVSIEEEKLHVHVAFNVFPD